MLESCAPQFRRVVAVGCCSESRLVRAVAVRLCTKAAGLGGGMGVFLAQPVLEDLQVSAAQRSTWCLRLEMCRERGTDTHTCFVCFMSCAGEGFILLFSPQIKTIISYFTLTF